MGHPPAINADGPLHARRSSDHCLLLHGQPGSTMTTETLQGRILQIDSDPAPDGKQVVILQIEMPESELVPFADFALEVVKVTITK